MIPCRFWAAALLLLISSLTATPLVRGAAPPRNAKLADVPANTWVKMNPTFKPGGYDYGGFGHPHGESVLVYDAGAERCIWWGGCSNGYCNQTWIYDASADTWTEANPDRYGLINPSKGIYGGKYVLDDKVPQGGCSYGACYDPEVAGIIFGNSLNSGWVSPPPEIARTLKPWNVWIYRAATNRWTPSPLSADPLKSRPRNYGCYLLCYDSTRHKTLMYGGLDAASGLTNDLYEYDSKQNSWSKIAPRGMAPPPRKYPTWAFDDRRGIAIAHGGTGQRPGTVGEAGQTPLNDTWEYDVRANQWREVQTAHAPPLWAARGPAAFDSRAGVLVKYCGRNTDEGPSETWIYNPTAADWRRMASNNRPDPGPQGVSPLYLTCYDRTNHVTLVVVHGETWAYRY